VRTFFRPDVTYSYDVGGVRYTGDKVPVAGTVGANTDPWRAAPPRNIRSERLSRSITTRQSVRVGARSARPWSLAVVDRSCGDAGVGLLRHRDQ